MYEVTEKFCYNCGSKLVATAAVCGNCGIRQHDVSAQGRGCSRLAAGMLAIFLGTFGIHKFYLGKPIWGVAYIVFAVTFLSTLVGIVEGLWYLTMSDNEFTARYN